ncbi:MAG: hypothetical protein A3I39_00010 [Candidatus Yanofskybacteria bacterium RIFCSPLOWO2_02_FULL_47_9b]|uniref:Transposase IS200-like domain-containing protein n=1 Tax=Candidatus Yanofskybacteria bacterium RIFCSPLOWO2_02_FULL_47_9b TaxID=1802708 RepID=A0A1F8H9G0_9BACT|nr:MAG: hypothetical protein A3I39_00010 [Candidatus Yanofskybacteria bacterium RIFCSPLOWO2_02_FULL_47_9b]
MFTRDYKTFAPGEFFHIYNRGNNKQDIFLDDSDYEFFLLRIKQNLYPDRFKELKIQPLPQGSFTLISYCLMPNHFHLLVRQNGDIPTSKLMLKICSSYSKVFNKKYERVGHVFQDQFKQILIGRDEYIKWLMAYICQNPKIAGLVKSAIDYKWSSYREYFKRGNDILCDNDTVAELFGKQNISEFIENSYKIIKNNKIGRHIESEALID